MIRQTSIDYSKLFDVKLEEKLKPIDQTIDNMLTRLEECETMIALVQQERCNSVGLTGSLSQAVDNRAELKEMYKKINALEKLVDHVNNNVETLERKMDEAEKHFGISDSMLKSFFGPIFKKVGDAPEGSASSSGSRDVFSTEDYFNVADQSQEEGGPSEA
ncbi:biogenesis of lysosome-related organelles complex 1 subunit 4 [Onthophagus taurus]|uniref:biogenesis of lysosome-related organelles complex 1 subunit 4 n=1 Tax=Onthophagus taurus TaxID=166361 RepID=UPI000C208A1C|nr:uncharacterized protein LOC111421223 [Onthophagus taurus]